MDKVLQLAITAGLATVTTEVHYTYSVDEVRQMVIEAANEVHLNSELFLRQLEWESTTRRRVLDYLAVGDDGEAIGLGQIWRRYARWYIKTFWPDAPVVHDITVNKLSDEDVIVWLLHPQNSARLVARIMSWRMRKTENHRAYSYAEAVAVYNMGLARYKKLEAEYGPAALAYVPPATARYIMYVLWDTK